MCDYVGQCEVARDKLRRERVRGMSGIVWDNVRQCDTE